MNDIWKLIEKEGFTAKIHKNIIQEVKFKKGFQVGLSNNKCNIDDKNFKKWVNNTFKKHKNIIRKRIYEKLGVKDIYIGGWKDGNVYYIDFSVWVEDIEKAKEIAKRYKQKAVWDWEKQECIYL